MASLPPCWAGSPSEASSPVTGRSMPILMVPLIVWVVVPPPPQAARIRPVTASPASNLGLFIRFLLLLRLLTVVTQEYRPQNCEPFIHGCPTPVNSSPIRNWPPAVRL